MAIFVLVVLCITLILSSLCNYALLQEADETSFCISLLFTFAVIIAIIFQSISL